MGGIPAGTSWYQLPKLQQRQAAQACPTKEARSQHVHVVQVRSMLQLPLQLLSGNGPRVDRPWQQRPSCQRAAVARADEPYGAVALCQECVRTDHPCCAGVQAAAQAGFPSPGPSGTRTTVLQNISC